jgi:hypothetical protein
MTDHPYQPPERQFADTMLAYRDFVIAGAWSVPRVSTTKRCDELCGRRVCHDGPHICQCDQEE